MRLSSPTIPSRPLAALLFSALLLSGCGGNGSGNDGPAVSRPLGKEVACTLSLSPTSVAPGEPVTVTGVPASFSNPGMRVIARDASIQGAKDLAGKTVSAQTGTTYLDYVQKNVPGVKRVVNFPTNEAAMNALMTQRADAWVTDKFVAKTAVGKNSDRLQRGEMVFTEKVSFIAKVNTNKIVMVPK